MNGSNSVWGRHTNGVGPLDYNNREGGRLNMLYLDGHVVTQTKKSLAWPSNFNNRAPWMGP